MTADELRDLASRMYRAAVERQARTSRRRDDERRAHAELLTRCDELERALNTTRSNFLDAMDRLRAAEDERDELRAQYRCAECKHNRDELDVARSQLALAMAWGAELADAARCEASLRWRWEARADEARRALSIAEADASRMARERDEALEALARLEEDVDEHLPEYVLEDGTGDEANVRERIEYAGAEIDRLRERAKRAEVDCELCLACRIEDALRPERRR